MDIQARIEQGRRAVFEYNSGRSEEEQIRFDVTLKNNATNNN